MTFQSRLRQSWIIAMMETRRTFLSRRSFWVYLLAIFPTVIFIGHGLEVKFRAERWSRQQLTPAEKLAWVDTGERADEVLRRAGPPIRDFEWTRRRSREESSVDMRHLMYFDGTRRHDFFFENGLLSEKQTSELVNFEEERTVFATLFQYFYLRLAIFFGCLGIFMNLFRGEMLDKTLHYWLLLPARREVLLFGKYVAGVVAATVIFTTGAVLCFGAMLWPQDPALVASYWNLNGPMHLARYAASAALASVGYGSVFLAAGLLVRNPIVPAAVLLLWESINGFLPELLQKISVLYYAQSLTPIPAASDPDMPVILKLLLNPSEPAPVWAAVLGLAGVTALVLWAASSAVKRLEINYGGD